MDRLSISKVFLEEQFEHDDGLIQPDITIEHLNGSRTFVEIVDYSSPHKNSNAWKFYEKQQENLVVIDIKGNQEGWHFNTEKIHMILIEKFEKHFNDRTTMRKCGMKYTKFALITKKEKSKIIISAPGEV